MVENNRIISPCFHKIKTMDIRRSFFFALAVGFTLAFFPVESALAQDAAEEPEVVTLRSQYDDLARRTRIYEGFRAIREDMFQEIRKQSLDSLSKARERVTALETELQQASSQIEQQAVQLEEANAVRDEALNARDSISFLGKPLKKGLYNTLVWSLIGALAVLALVLLVITRNARRLSRQRAADLNDVLQEYENYRKTSRERLERITVDHFNEIKKLKGL